MVLNHFSSGVGGWKGLSKMQKSDKKHDCLCGSEENMKHIYNCRILNNGEEQMLKYDKIYNGKVSKQKDIWKIFERNMKICMKIYINKKIQKSAIYNLKQVNL